MEEGSMGVPIPDRDMVSGHPISDDDSDDFQRTLGESLESLLDVRKWTPGAHLASLYEAMQERIERAVRDESDRARHIREGVFPNVEKAPRAAPGAGLYRFDVPTVMKTHRGLLFNGGVEACDGTVAAHDSLALTIAQIGVCLVSYNGEQGCYAHKMYRRDVCRADQDPLSEAFEVLKLRTDRNPVGEEHERDEISDLMRRGIMAYAERSLLLEHSKALWRMGHGNPVPYELLTGRWAHDSRQGSILVRAALGLMSRLVEHRRFVYVPSVCKRDLLYLGYALRPLECLVIRTLKDDLNYMHDQGGYRGEARRMMKQFADEIGPQVVMGLYRVSDQSPPYVFYAHAEFAPVAGLIALADSALQEHRGFPMLIDIADTLCRSAFDPHTFKASVWQAYARAGRPSQYLGERETRR
jgi:hypothetical protein